MTGPFHPDSDDEMVVIRDGKTERQPATTTGEMSFTPAIRHIHRVVRGLEEPRHLAVDEAMGNAAGDRRVARCGPVACAAALV